MDASSGARQVTALSDGELSQAMRRCIATMADAVAIAEAAVDLLGERAFLDPWCKPGDRIAYLHDRAHPEWLIGQAFLVLDIGVDVPEPTFADPKMAEMMAALRREEPQVTSTDLRPGLLILREGRRILQVSINRKGLAFEWMRSSGDPWPDGAYTSARGFCFDPSLLVHTQPQPLSLLCRADLEPEGEPPRTFAPKVAAIDNSGDVAIRVRMPAPVPGGVGGCVMRALIRLKELSWEADLDDPAKAGWSSTGSITRRSLPGRRSTRRIPPGKPRSGVNARSRP